MNRIHNASNPYQGEAKRVLCVCSAGLLRSPTAAVVLNRELGWNTRAAGLSKDYALIVVDGPLLAWADLVVCMSAAQKEEIIEITRDYGFRPKPIISLDIADEYSYMDEELQKLILNNIEGKY